MPGADDHSGDAFSYFARARRSGKTEEMLRRLQEAGEPIIVGFDRSTSRDATGYQRVWRDNVSGELRRENIRPEDFFRTPEDMAAAHAQAQASRYDVHEAFRNSSAERVRREQTEQDAHMAEMLRKFQEALRAQQEAWIDDLLRDVVPRPPFSPGRPAATPERTKAIVQLRAIKRLRDSTTFDGERESAQLRMNEIMAKHGIAEREI